MNGAQWIVQALQRKNVDIIFGYPGGAIMPLYDALFNSGLEHLLCRHEQGAIFSAIGYAKATGKIGICFATSGPGATNLVTGLADALLDSVPIIAITGQVSLDLMGTDAFQEIDVLGLSLACTKHSFLVQSLTMLPDIINEAFFLVSNGRPGPILIDIPKDIQLETGNFFTKSYIFSKKGNTCSVSYEDINRARLLMSQSCRPILYVGGGVGIADAVVSLRRFILKTGIPTVVTLKGLGSADCSQDCYLGMLGMHGNQAANLAVQQCDLLIAVGARFDDRVTGKLSSFAPYAKVIHLDIDSAEFGKLRSVDVSLLGDLNNLLLRLEQCLFIDSWKKSIRLLKKKYRWIYSNTDEVIYAPSLLRVISDCAPKNTIVTTDVGQHQMWTAQHMKFNYPENFITSGGLGTMGFGIPAAIGAEIGRPGYTVVCISGDGSFMMNIQELATIKRKGLSTKIVLLDNQSLGMVRQWQELFFEKRYSETKLKDNPNFLILARAFDISGICIKDKTQIKDGVKLLFEHNGPFLLHVIISDNENVWPLVPPGSSNSSMLEKL